MAMSNKEAWEAIDPTWRKGIDSIYSQLQSILSSYGVSEVTPIGEIFNPAIHDAMTNVTVANKEEHHKIISVIQNGYIRNTGEKEELIRPARVTVGEYAE
jgi:molecular chaperone GrpE